MRKIWEDYRWILATAVGSAVFALGFSLFLQPNEISPGGISGLALVAVALLGCGSVGVLTILINLPLFILGGMKIGRRFFFGSLMGMILSSVLIDAFAQIPMPPVEPLLSALYGGMICGLGLGVVFICGTSTGGSDIVVRLLKLKYRDVPIGQISMCFDLGVAILTGIAFRDFTKALYTGVAVFVSGKVVDAVVYRFDYSKVALIITKEYDKVAEMIGTRLDRGATFLNGEGSYSHAPTKVVLTAVKKQQVTELKELVMAVDPTAFVIVQEAHQVLGDGFSHYSKQSL
ncbi:MAG TPA: YitT family protein [Clostridiales bacterium]|nr:YitT family protein [Clostridiales bacterium]HBK26175.1 YitT family protein [Clostridiales bacterium]